MSADPSPPDVARFGRFELLFAERRLRAGGQPVALGSRAFDLLAALVARRERIVPKEELIALVWPGLVVEDNNLQAQVSALRKALGAGAIATVPGRGYQFTLPAEALAPQEAAAAPKAPTVLAREEGSAMRPSRLLVADDNKVNRLLLCRSLALMGHEVASAEDGRSALAMLRNQPFDLLLLDLEMPGLDGFGLLELRAADQALLEVPVIVTSSLEGVGQVARCIELGADDYLHKPVNPLLLKARVEASLARKHGRDRERALLERLARRARDSSGERAAGAASRVEATVLVARLTMREAPASFDPLTAPEALELLGAWSTLMVDAIESHAGVPVQIAGDGVTAVFGGSGAGAVAAEAAGQAMRAAREMQELLVLFDAERTAASGGSVVLGIGIASGSVVTGQLGMPGHVGFVCVGDAVQRAAALAVVAGEPGGDGLGLDDETRAVSVEMGRPGPSLKP